MRLNNIYETLIIGKGLYLLLLPARAKFAIF